MKICVATMGPSDLAEIAQYHLGEVVDDNIHVNPGTIERFDTARNDLLRYAHEQGCDWAIMLDTDERLQFEDTLRVPGEVWSNAGSTRLTLQDVLSQTRSDVLMVRQADGTYAKERIFRLPARGRYHGPTHEAFILDDGASRSMLEGVVFTEDPKTHEQYRAKAERDLRILEGYTKDHPDDPRWYYYLGDTREGLGDLNGARYAFAYCFNRWGWDEEAAWAAFRVAKILSNQGDYQGAIAWCANGMERRADFPELPWLAGWCCYQQGKYEQAIAWSKLAIAHNTACPFTRLPRPDRVIFRHPPAHYEAPYDVIRWSLRALGNPSDHYETLFDMRLKERQKSER